MPAHSRLPRSGAWPRHLARALFVLAPLAAGGGWRYLQSSRGQALIRGEVISALQGVLHASAEVGSLAVDGRELTLRDLKLYGPEHRLLAEVDVLRLDVSTAGLLQGRFVADDGLALRPRLYLPAGARGLDLLRAITSGSARVDLGPGASPRRSVLLRHVSVEGGSIVLGRPGEGPILDGLSGAASAAWSGAERSFHAEVVLRAEGGSLDASCDADASGELRADLRRASVGPRAAAALGLPPLQLPIQLSGTAELHGDTVRAQVQGASGRARALLRGMLDLRRRWSDGLTLAVRGVDLSELTRGGPPTDLSVEASARGGGPSLDALQGTVDLAVPPSQVRGVPLGPLRLSASADRGQLHLPELSAELPGLSATASGDGTVERFSMRGALRASDLSALWRALGQLGPRPAPPLGGTGTIRFSMEGPVRHPRVTLEGDFPRLQLQGDLAEGVKLWATAADGAQPLAAVAKLEAASLHVGGRRYHQLSVELACAREAIRVDARATGLLGEAGELAAHLAGDVDPDARGLLVRELSIRYPEATWTLQGPAHVAAGGETGITAEPLHLTSGTQELTVAGRASRESVDAALQTRRLDLGRLPAGLVDPALDLAGLVDVEVSARGPWVDLVATGSVRLQRGRVRRWDELDISLSGTCSGGRASGNLRLASPLARLGATFDLPVMGLAQRRHERIDASVTMDEQAIAPLLAAAGWPGRLTGTALGTLSLTGTADDPSAQVHLTVRNLDAPQYMLPPQRQPTMTVTLAANQSQGVQAKVTVAAAAMSTRGELTVRTPLALADLLAHPPDREELMSAAGSMDVALTDLPLEVFKAARDRHLSGRASFSANVTGTLRDPKVGARLEGGVDLEDEATRARSSPGAGATSPARRASLVLTDLAARIVAQVRERWRALTDARAPDVKRSGPASECLPDDGALSDVPPELLAAAGSQPAGHAFIRGAATYRYEAQRSTLVAYLASAGGGRARLDGTLEMDLSLPALLRGVDPGKAAAGATLEARDLELAVLKGSLPRVLEIGGQLSANARVARAADASDVQGCLALRGGELAIDEYGSYRAIQLRADASGKTIRISPLEVQSGSGYAELTADLTPAGGGVLRVTGKARSDTFPIIYRYQTHAAVSSQLTFKGDLSRSGVSLDQVEIQEARIQLPEDQLADLSDIGLPRDIALVDGEPVERQEEKAAGAEPPSWRHSFTVVKAQKVRLESPDVVNMDVDLSDGFHFEYAGDAAVTGTVRVAGQHAGIFLLGREFGLHSDSQLTFTGSLRYPELNITGDYVNDHEGVTVTMRALNKGKSLVLEPTSNPPLSAPEIFTLLATGRRVVKRGSCSSMCGADAATAVGALLTTRFRNLFAKYLLLDEISIESGGGDGLKGMRFGAGWRFSNGLSAGVKVQVGADPLKGENTYEIYTEYPLTPDLSLQTQYGDGNAGGVDLVWSREY